MAPDVRPSGRVVVTGLGAVSPVGVGVEPTWTAIKAGTPKPPVAVVVATRPQLIGPDEKAALERAFEDRPHVVLVASTRPLTVKPP